MHDLIGFSTVILTVSPTLHICKTQYADCVSNANERRSSTFGEGRRRRRCGEGELQLAIYQGRDRLILDVGGDLRLATAVWSVLPRSLLHFVYFVGHRSTVTFSQCARIESIDTLFACAPIHETIKSSCMVCFDDY